MHCRKWTGRRLSVQREVPLPLDTLTHNGDMDCTEPVIDEYVATLERALSGPERVRRELVAEARGHLLDATEAYGSAGWHHRDAAELAVQDFGPVRRVAEGYQSLLAVAASRRAALTLLALLLPQAFLWDNGLHLAPSPTTGEAGLASFLHSAIEWLGFGALAIALVTLVIAGVGQRWVAAGPWLARWTGVSVAVCAIGSGVLGLCLLVLNGAASTALWALVLVLLVLPMAWTVRSAHQCLRTA